MLKKILYIILLASIPFYCLSQIAANPGSNNNKTLDVLRENLLLAKSDSAQITALERLGFYFVRVNTDSSIYYYNTALNMGIQKKYAWAESRMLAGLSSVMEHQGKLAEAFDLLFRSLKIATEYNSTYDIARACRRIGTMYFQLEYYPQAISYIQTALYVDKASHLDDKVAIDNYALADAYEKANMLDSANYYIQLAFQQKKLLKQLMQSVYVIDGHIKQKKEKYAEAEVSYRIALEEAEKSNDFVTYSLICADFSSLWKQLGYKDSCEVYALKGLAYSQKISKKGVLLNGSLLAELYDSTRPALALHYFKMASAAKDSLFGVNSIKAIQSLLVKEQARQRELEDAKKEFNNRLKLYGLLAGIIALLLIAYIQFRNNSNKQKANRLLEKTLQDLKSTQSQLVQSEKMASLGELTAGIAHEIQNPLNFVNNFSEVNNELIDEMNEQLDKGDIGEAKIVANDIKQNLEKINQHGKRADAIVKGMLQHSRKTIGEKEPVDINALADEYLRLSYHGLRAKDNSFNTTITTSFDPSVGKLLIIPQDIGRVLLNVYNNAFYALQQKQKKSKPDSTLIFDPVILVSTRKMGDKVEIRVEDNGGGIPSNIIDKIFQPFFTTKPTGQGTGLGLSLSYDIVKAHGGDIKVEVDPGATTTFIIQLPQV